MKEKAAEQCSVDQDGTAGGKGRVEDLIRTACENLKEGDAPAALGFLNKALEIDFEHQELLYILKCLNWWLEKIKRLKLFHEPYERGDYILSQWKSYEEFLERITPSGICYSGSSYDSCQFAIKHFVFSRALEYFLELLGDGINQQDPLLLLQAGRCCKAAGDWDEALKHLKQAGRFRRDDAAIISELADVNALLGDEQAAKVLFREAFFLDPQGVNLSGLESEMILGLRNKVKELGYSGPELAEWIPVWGCIWGIFSVKRELKPVEYSRLKQSILSLESEHRSKSPGAAVKPRLLNKYFWLMDHCEHNRDTMGLEDTMLRIKYIDPVIHEHYNLGVI